MTLCGGKVTAVVLVRSYPDREQLQTIYGAYLQPVLQRSMGEPSVWSSAGKVHQLAGSLVQVYEQVSRVCRLGRCFRSGTGGHSHCQEQTTDL